MRTRTRSPSRRRRLLGRRRWSFSAYRRGWPARWRNESGFLLGLSLGRFLAVGGFAADRISWLAGPFALTHAHARPNGNSTDLYKPIRASLEPPAIPLPCLTERNRLVCLNAISQHLSPYTDRTRRRRPSRQPAAGAYATPRRSHPAP